MYAIKKILRFLAICNNDNRLNIYMYIYTNCLEAEKTKELQPRKTKSYNTSEQQQQ